MKERSADKGIAILLAVISAISQYGCSSAQPDAIPFARSSSSPAKKCHGYDERASECRSIEKAMLNLRKPDDLDNFLFNLQFLISTDTLRNPEFYNSNDYIVRAFGARSISRETNITPEDPDRSFRIIMRMGNSPSQWCAISRLVNERFQFQFVCSGSTLLYLYYRDKPGSAQPDTEMSGELIEGIYIGFKNNFDGEWASVNEFDKKNGEGITDLPKQYRSLHPSQIERGLGTDLPVGSVIYRVRVGSQLIGSTENGITVTVKNRDSK